jgi:hypothetical protein
MKKLLGLIALLVVVDGFIFFFYGRDSSPQVAEQGKNRFSDLLKNAPIKPNEPPPLTPPLPVLIVFFACLALIAVGTMLVLYLLWSRCSMQGKCLCMAWLIIILFILVGLFPPVYSHIISSHIRSWGEQNSFAFLFDIPDGYRIRHQTLFVEWAIATAIPVGVIITLRIKNRSS